MQGAISFFTPSLHCAALDPLQEELSIRPGMAGDSAERLLDQQLGPGGRDMPFRSRVARKSHLKRYY